MEIARVFESNLSKLPPMLLPRSLRQSFLTGAILCSYFACATAENSDQDENFDAATTPKKQDARADQSSQSTDSSSAADQTASDSSSTADTGGGDAGKDTSVKDTGTSEAGSSDTGSTDTGVVDSGILPDASSNPPGNGVVINEIDYDQAGLDEAEFVEIYNPTAVSQDLSTLALAFFNGANNMSVEYLRIPLKGMLASKGYYVLAVPSLMVDPSATVERFALASNNIQNGNPDAVAIIDTAKKQVVDALSYGGSVSNFAEGTPTTEKDSNTADGSLIREPNGTDTNNALADWKFTKTATPGKANTLTP